MNRLVLPVLFVASVATAQEPLDTVRIEKLTGANGALDAKEGVFKVSVPRTDLSVTAAGVRLTPPLGLTSWAAFRRAGKDVMVMGDLVLLEDQVNPVMSAALDNGLEVTALHDHFFWDTPQVMFMHVGGHGSEEVLTTAIGRVFARMAETAGGRGEVPPADIDPARSTLDAKKIEAVLGAASTTTAGVAIHQHMTHEEPRILFLHYWGVGPAAELARGVRSALDSTAPKRAAAADVVFVCEHGSVKSVIAAEWFNRLAREHGSSLRAVARGLTPDAAMPATIAAALAEDGFDVTRFQPTAFDGTTEASRVVTFGLDVKTDAALRRWDGVPPATERWAESSTEIRRRVEALFAEMTR